MNFGIEASVALIITQLAITCSKLTIKRHRTMREICKAKLPRSDIYIVNSERVLRIVLFFPHCLL